MQRPLDDQHSAASPGDAAQVFEDNGCVLIRPVLQYVLENIAITTEGGGRGGREEREGARERERDLVVINLDKASYC